VLGFDISLVFDVLAHCSYIIHSFALKEPLYSMPLTTAGVLVAQALFDLSQLLAYRRGEYNPMPILSKVSCASEHSKPLWRAANFLPLYALTPPVHIWFTFCLSAHPHPHPRCAPSIRFCCGLYTGILVEKSKKEA
jgi:hypothetical protein